MISCLNPGTLGGQPPLPEFLPLAASNGFGGVEFNILDAARLAREISQPAVIALFTDNNVAPASFGLPVEWRLDTAAYQADLKGLPRLARMAQEMGCTRTGTWLPPAVVVDPREFRRQTVRRFQEIASILADFDIRFALEWVGPRTFRQPIRALGGSDFVWNIPATLELIADIGEPSGNVGVLADSFHWFTTGATVSDLAALGDKIVHVHINDAPDRARDDQVDKERLLPGEGVIDLHGFLGALRMAGYGGFVSVETFDDSLAALGPEEAARRAADSLKPYLP
jgi:sugar phosphate isomerase/epimerase